MAAAATNWVICIALLLSLSFGMCAVRRNFRLSSNLRLRQLAASNTTNSKALSQASNISNSTTTLQTNFNSSTLYPYTSFGQSGWVQKCADNDETEDVDCTCYPEGPAGCGYFDCDCDFKDDDGRDDRGGGGEANTTVTCDFVRGCMANETNLTAHLIQVLTQKLVAKGLLEY